MKWFPAIAALLFSLALSPSSLAQRQQAQAQPQTDSQSQNMQDHVITVSRGGEAYAKPDLGILLMSIRSSGPIAEEAVAANGRKAADVEAALAKLGFAPQGYKITPVTFGQAARFGPMQPDVTLYEANQLVYVFFEAPDLTDVAQLTQKSAAVIEALRKAGAVPANAASPMFAPMQAGLQGALIIYTIKDSAPYEKQALQQAIARARDAAQDIALGTNVQLGGLRNVKSTFLYGNYGPRQNQVPLDGLSYRWYSAKSDEVEIGANATLDYNFK